MTIVSLGKSGKISCPCLFLFGRGAVPAVEAPPPLSEDEAAAEDPLPSVAPAAFPFPFPFAVFGVPLLPPPSLERAFLAESSLSSFALRFGGILT